MAHLDDLPQEILNLITRFLKSDNAALFDLSITSRRFTHETRLLLYSDIKVVDPVVYMAYAPTGKTLCIHIDVQRSAMLFTTFTIHNPALAQYVQSFAYNAWTMPEPHYVDLMQQSLRLMTSLKTLQFDFRALDIIPDTFFDGCTFQLTHFRFGNGLPFENQLQDFLMTQPQLQYLCYTTTFAPFPPDCLPNLRTLSTGNWNETFKVLIGRPTICHLELYGASVRDTNTIVPGALGNITVLACKGVHDFEAFEAAIPELKRLRVLALVGLVYLSEIRQKPEVIAGLKSLSTYVWSTPPTRVIAGIWKDWGPESHASAVHLWFQNIPDLKKVYIQVGGVVDDGRNYAYWGEDGGEPTLVQPSEVVEGYGFLEFDLIR